MIDLSKLAVKTEPSEAAAALTGAHVGFVVKPSEIYPAMIAEIKAILGDDKLAPDKFLDLKGTPNPLRMYYDEAKSLGADGMDLALVPHAETSDLKASGKIDRNRALECARKWFTELLHQSIGGKPMGLRILAEDKAFKLC